MSKADQPISTPVSGVNRRGLLRGAAGVIAVSTVAAATVPRSIAGSAWGHTALAEMRRLIAAMRAADDEVGAAEEDDDPTREAAAEAEYRRLREEWLALVEEIHDTPPRSAIDVLTRAEIASMRLDRKLLDAQPEQWAELVDGWHDERAFVQLTLAVLWLARSEEGPANV